MKRYVIGVDGYNGTLTYDVGMTITDQRIGVQNIPVVIIKQNTKRKEHNLCKCLTKRRRNFLPA